VGLYWTGTLQLADRVGVTERDIDAKLMETAVQVDFQGGLLWYQENVVVPLLNLAGNRVPVGEVGDADEAELSNIKFLEKESATFAVVAAYMAGEAYFSLFARG
jgi:hypothetical protein